MIKLELLRKELDFLKENLAKRKFDSKILSKTLEIDIKYREKLALIESLNSKKNQISKEIAVYFKEKNTSKAEASQKEVLEIKKTLEEYKKELLVIETELNNSLLNIPNILQEEVVYGESEEDNVEVSKFSSPTKFSFEPKSHWDLSKEKDIIDFENATKIAGSRFVIYKKDGAKLFRALQQYTLDINIEAGFEELMVPVIVNKNSLLGSGQLPKFEEDLFSLENDFYLSPTGEVQLLNIHNNEIIKESDLPLMYTTNTPCFRSEAGSAGRDTKGVIRQHQFWKSELVVFSTPENSEAMHEKIVKTAESVLESLNLPYRKLLLCSTDTGFTSSKTYDLEVWLPSYNDYKEISSCSNCLDFQANRAKIRYRKSEDNKTENLHTLNGSSLAIDRLWAAVVENYQNKDGTISIPKPLVKYMNKEKI